MGIIIPILLIIITSIFIWKASDGFDKASSYLGRNLSDGVKGAKKMSFLQMFLESVVIC
jgi:cation:H+ antiporter